MLRSNNIKKKTGVAYGFSLIEIMVALAVLSTAFFGLIKVFPLGIEMNTSSKNKTVASYLAQDKIESLYSQGYDNIATGTIETKHRLSASNDSYLYNYHRETVVDYIDGNLTATSGDSGMKRISTTIYYPEGANKGEQSFQVSTIISKN